MVLYFKVLFTIFVTENQFFCIVDMVDVWTQNKYLDLSYIVYFIIKRLYEREVYMNLVYYESFVQIFIILLNLLPARFVLWQGKNGEIGNNEWETWAWV